MAFVHLRMHTEFSVVDGTLRVDEAVQAAAADGQGALAITDLSNLFGAIKFYTAARKAGVKPVIGADVWLEPEAGEKAGSRLLLLVQDRTGYLNLCELLSRAWLSNVQRNQSWLKWECTTSTCRRASFRMSCQTCQGDDFTDSFRPPSSSSPSS